MTRRHDFRGTAGALILLVAPLLPVGHALAQPARASIDFDQLATPRPEFDQGREVRTSDLPHRIYVEVEAHGNRHNAHVQQRRSSGGSSGSSGSSGSAGSPEPASGTRSSAGGGNKAFRCEYRCTNAKLLGSDKTRLSVVVNAPDARAAEAQAVRHATDTCYADTKRIFENGSASCRPQ